MIARLAVLMIVVSLSACTGDTPSAPTPPVTGTPPTTPTPPAAARVEGVVLDFQSATPIAGAVVGFATDFFLEPRGMTETAVTDANGRYSLPEPPPLGGGRRYVFVVNNQEVGRGFPRATARGGDVAVDKGKCIARYGLVLDSVTYAPIAGATARSLSNELRATTDQNGWYHIDWGCGTGSAGFGTQWSVMSHPDYNPSNFAGGRGISGNYREDVLLTRR